MSSSAARDARIQDLLSRTSRTFALAIPLLPSPTQLEVSIAYLLFRVADTIEDGPHLSCTEKLDALTRYHQWLNDGDISEVDTGSWLPRPPCDDTDCLQLLDDLPLVMEVAQSLQPEVRAAILACACSSISGMKRFLAAGGPVGGFQLQSLEELRNYCYYVAGIVGEMLTAIFVAGSPKLVEVRRELEQNARWFGEGLQLVNILKDSEIDRTEGRRFIPSQVSRERLFELTREDLGRATAYVAALRRASAPAGVVAFTDLPLQLAWRTLNCVERSGPGSKVPRSEVMQILDKSIRELSRSSASPEGLREVAAK